MLGTLKFSAAMRHLLRIGSKFIKGKTMRFNDLRIWALVNTTLNSIEYCDESYTKVRNMLKLLAPGVRQHFEVVRFDVAGCHRKED